MFGIDLRRLSNLACIRPVSCGLSEANRCFSWHLSLGESREEDLMASQVRTL